MAVRDEQHLKETRGSLPWREALSHISAVLLVGGLLLYGYLSICYDRFYRNLGVDPNDVGLSYAGTLARSSGFVIVCLLLSIPLQLLATHTLNWWRKTSTDKTMRLMLLVAVLITMVPILAFLRQPWRSSGASVQNVRNAVPVGPVTLPLQFRVGRSRKIGPELKVTILAIRADSATVQPAGKPKDFPALQQFKDDTLMYLGQSEGTVVLFDANGQSAIYLPASSIILQVNVICREQMCF